MRAISSSPECYRVQMSNELTGYMHPAYVDSFRDLGRAGITAAKWRLAAVPEVPGTSP